MRDASKKPSLLPMRRVSSRAAPSLSPVAGISEGEDGVSGGGSTPAPSDGAPSSSPPPPVVLMLASSAAYYDQQQSDGSLAIEVLRTGEPWRRVSVEYRTRDGDARAGEHFEAADGTLVFEPGETSQTITVALTPASGSWRPTLDFVVELHTPSGGASLPAHEDGRMCSVWLISTAQFPSNAVDHLSSRFELAKALTVWLWEDETVRNGTLKTVAIDLFSSLVFLWQLLVMEYFVNEVLHVLGEGGHARMQLVVLCGLSHAVPELILNRLRVLVCWFGVGGAARKRLRVNLLRRFMSYTEASRRRTGVAGCIEVLYRDAVEVRAALARPNKEHAHLQHSLFTTSFCRPSLVCPQYACPCGAQVVDNGYSKMVDSTRSAGKMCVILLWAYGRAAVLTPILVIIPIYMLWRAKQAERASTTLRLKYFKALHQMIGFAEDVARHQALVRDYALVQGMARTFAVINDDVNYFANAVWHHTTENKLSQPALASILLGVMMAISPMVMESFALTTGVYIAGLQAMQSMGVEGEGEDPPSPPRAHGRPRASLAPR